MEKGLIQFEESVSHIFDKFNAQFDAHLKVIQLAFKFIPQVSPIFFV